MQRKKQKIDNLIHNTLKREKEIKKRKEQYVQKQQLEKKMQAKKSRELNERIRMLNMR